MLGRLPRLMPLCPMQVLDSHETKNQHLHKEEKTIKRRPGHHIKNKEDVKICCEHVKAKYQDKNIWIGMIGISAGSDLDYSYHI